MADEYLKCVGEVVLTLFCAENERENKREGIRERLREEEGESLKREGFIILYRS